MRSLLALNEHPVERAARVGLGLVLVGLAAGGSIGAWGYVGLVFVLTGLVGSCPIYTLLGISTCRMRGTKS